MTELRLKPGYDHKMGKNAPKSVLTAETALFVYEKLRSFLAIKVDPYQPGNWIQGLYSRDLFERNGFHHPVRWMPSMRGGWKRLAYDEFCVWYGLLK